VESIGDVTERARFNCGTPHSDRMRIVERGGGHRDTLKTRYASPIQD